MVSGSNETEETHSCQEAEDSGKGFTVAQPDNSEKFFCKGSMLEK